MKQFLSVLFVMLFLILTDSCSEDPLMDLQETVSTENPSEEEPSEFPDEDDPKEPPKEDDSQNQTDKDANEENQKDSDEEDNDEDEEPGEETPGELPVEEEKVSIELPLPEFISPDAYIYIKDLEVEDPINNCTWLYNLLLPPSYNTNEGETYPVLYLLHGLDGNRNVWTSGALILKDMLDYCYYQFSLPEMIIVLPDAKNTYYVNDYQDNIRYEDFFFNLLMPEIENNFRISTSRHDTMIAGFSMGGYGSTYYAFTHKDVFGFCYAISAPFQGESIKNPMPSLLPYFEGLKAEDMPKFIFDIGYQDSFYASNVKLDKLLNDKQLPHHFIERNGKHDAQFWKESLYFMLQYINIYIR